jgi:hypothetical protein
MTRKGYTHIIVPTQLHNQLKNLASQKNVSISRVIFECINTGINTAQMNPKNLKPEICLNSTNRPQNVVGSRGVWWGCGDLNSGSRGLLKATGLPKPRSLF